MITANDNINDPNRLTSSGTRPRKDGRKVKLPLDPNPVFIEKGAWWFFCADWINVKGPFDCVEELDAALDKYLENL